MNIRKRKRVKGSLRFEDVDTYLFEWFCLARAKSVPISGNILKTKGIEIAAAAYGNNSFNASSGWLDSFKTRYRISLKAISGESAGVNMLTVEEWKEQLPAIIEDIYNLDETGLFWKTFPKKSYAQIAKIDKCQGKKSANKLSIGLVGNMAGEKLPPIVIGNAKRPRAFDRVNVEKTFNIHWYSNKTSWMTGLIMSDYLRKLDAQMARKKRKFLIFIDNATSHPDLAMDNIKIIFFPPNTTSALQPMDAGIIHSFKAYYRKSLLQQNVTYIDNLITDTDTPEPKVDQFNAVNWINMAWNAVKPVTLKNCFKHCGFIFNEENAMDVIEPAGDDGLLLEVVPNFTLQQAADYVNFDNNLATDYIFDIEDWQEEFLNELETKREDFENQEAIESDSESDELVPIPDYYKSLKPAIPILNGLVEFAKNVDDSSFRLNMTSALNSANCLFLNKAMRQPSIDSFLKKI